MARLPKEKRKYRYLTEEDKKLAFSLRKGGLSYRKIAEELGFSKSTIMWHLSLNCRRKAIERHIRWVKLNPKRDREIRKKYTERFKEIVGVPWSTLYDREPNNIKDRREKSKRYYWEHRKERLAYAKQNEN